MSDLGTAYVQIAPSMRGFTSSLSSGLSKAFSSSSSIGGSAGGSVSTAFAAKFATVSTLVSSTLSSVGTLISGSLGDAVSRVDTLNQFPKVMQNLGYSADDASSTMTKLSDGIEGLPTTLDSIVGYTQSLVSTVGDLDTASDLALAINDAMTTFGASTEGASTAITQLNQMMSSGTYDAQSWLSINNSAPGLLDTIAESMLGAGSGMEDLRTKLNDGSISTEEFTQELISLDQDGTDSLTAFSESAKTATGGIETSMTNVKTAVAKNLANVIDAFNEDGQISGFFDSVKDGVNDVGGSLTTAAQDASGWVGDMQGEFATLSESDADLSEYAMTVYESLRDDVLPKITEGLTDAGEQLAEDLPETLEAAWDVASQTLEDLTGFELPELDSEDFETAIEGVQSVMDGLGGALQTVKDNSDKIVPAVAAAAAAIGAYSVATTVATALKTLKGATEGMTVAQKALNLAMSANPIALVITVIAALAAALVTAYVTNEDFRDKVNEAFATVRRTVVNVVKTVVKKVKDIATTLANVAAKVVETVGNIVQAFLELKDKIVERIAQVVKVVGGIKDKVLDAIGDAGSWLVDTGKNIITGLVSGITSFTSKVKNAITKLAENLPKWAKNILGIKSPSKVFAEIGRFSVLGIVEGIDGASSSARSAVSRLVDGMSSTAATLSVGVAATGGAVARRQYAAAAAGGYGGVVVNISGDVVVDSDERMTSFANRLATAISTAETRRGV